MASIIILDNNPNSYFFNYENTIPIKTWFKDPDDTELLDILQILRSLARVKDVRTIIKRIMKKMDRDMKKNTKLVSSLYENPENIRENQRFLRVMLIGNFDHKIANNDETLIRKLEQEMSKEQRSLNKEKREVAKKKRISSFSITCTDIGSTAAALKSNIEKNPFDNADDEQSQSVMPSTIKASTNASELNNYNRIQTFLKVDQMKKPPSESGSEADDANEEVKVAKPPKRDILDWTEESEPSFANQAYKNFVNPSSESA
eukprot:CAMPEP_0168344464 /NCGR_PEP_ID=MMETSP0213-20121227/16843_1 /TAXON_ID=151035 /ORGANISM="Euplotes harpa, Strain FSP1.4" /LENGTH=259 /DNA_ID=CAMNT_0008352233 /DNA_START=425 /DNA_END=1201 /DNA_ORIENTATION=+